LLFLASGIDGVERHQLTGRRGESQRLMPDFNDPGSTRGSMIEGMRSGDARQWERFCQLYADWLTHRASRNLGLEHKDRAGDVSQNVILRLLRQRENFLRQRDSQALTYDPDVARFRAYLSTCIRNEAWAIMRPGRLLQVEGVEESPGDIDDQDDPDAEILLTIYKGVLLQIRSESHKNNPLPWQCFEDRLLRDKPAAEVASKLGISRDLVYQNVHRILEKIEKLCSARYEQDFPDVDRLQELKKGKIDTAIMKQVCGDILADELKTIDTRRTEANAYFRQILHDYLPKLEKQVRQLGPSHWPAFQSYTRSIALGEEPPLTPPAVERLLTKIDRLFRHRCSGDHGELSVYHYFRLRDDNVGIDPDAVAKLCGSFESEGSDNDNDRMSE
jgi:DNA-directed RNA polymerase specialized sigma24 family protein